MKKIALLLMMILATSVVDAKDYIATISNTDTNKYEDSLVVFTIYIDYSLHSILVSCENKSEEKMIFEWENMRINGTRIAFTREMVYEINQAKPDETIYPHLIASDRVCMRYYPVVPIVDKEKIKKEGTDDFSIIFSYRIGDKVFDKRLFVDVKIDKKKKKGAN